MVASRPLSPYQGDSSRNCAKENSQRGAQPGHITVTCVASDARNPPLTASSTTILYVEAPPPPPAPAPEIKELEAKLALHSIYFPTARPTAENPQGGLVDSQADILTILAQNYKNYLRFKPDAHLILAGHAASQEDFSQDCLIEYSYSFSEPLGYSVRRRERATLAAMQGWAGQ